MSKEIKINGKPLRVELSHAAKKAINKITKPLLVEMELYFSCLIRKKVHFYEDSRASEQAISVDDRLMVSFRPVMTRACGIDETDHGVPAVTDFPIQNAEAFIPRWLHIDYIKGKWSGEFGLS